jgi:MFS family permease
VRGARPVLALVVALQLVAETALTPYWPRLLRDLFGTEDLAATGTYLTVCRVAGLLALPLWGLAARRWPLPNLLVAGLLGSAVFDLGLALAPSLPLFTVLSAGVVATGSSMVLAYPALVAVADRGRGGDRLSGVVVYAAVFHAASVLATLVGAGVVALPQPRLGLAAFAVADLLLAVAVWRVVARRPAAVPVPADEAGTGPAEDAVRRRLPAGALLGVAALAVLVDLGTAVPRPFFTELVLRGGGSLTAAAVLFLLPALAGLAVLPAARPLARRWGRRLLPAAAGLAAAGLALQALGAAPGPAGLTALTAGRVVLGLGLGLLVVAVDLRVFAAVGTDGPGFTAVETARSGALLAAPLLATATAAVALPAPLAAAAVLMAAAALVSTLLRDAAPSPAPVAPDLVPVPEVLDEPAR